MDVFFGAILTLLVVHLARTGIKEYSIRPIRFASLQLFLYSPVALLVFFGGVFYAIAWIRD